MNLDKSIIIFSSIIAFLGAIIFYIGAYKGDFFYIIYGALVFLISLLVFKKPKKKVGEKHE